MDLAISFRYPLDFIKVSTAWDIAEAGIYFMKNSKVFIFTNLGI